MPLSMTSLSIVLLVSATSGSFSRAGVITATATVAGAVAAPVWGRLIDRMGQARVLVAAAVVCNLSLLLVGVTVLLRLPLALTLVSAVGVGLGFSSAGSCVRARWSHRLPGSPLLDTAYALEAAVDELVFIIGPVLATVLATAVHPALGLVACIVLGMTGAWILSRQHDTQPPTTRDDDGPSARPPLPVGVLVPVVVASAALGAVFGAMELVVVAFAKAAGVPGWTGFIVMAWGVGSLTAGVLTGAVVWKVSPTRRLRVGALLLACSVVPLPFVHHPLVVAALLLVSGLFISPTLIAGLAVTESSVPPRRLTEALGWTSMGMAAGLAAGAAGLGWVVDRAGASAGFWGVVVIGGLLVLSALCVRDAPVGAAPQESVPESTA